jgi:hypothetical protein
LSLKEAHEGAVAGLPAEVSGATLFLRLKRLGGCRIGEQLDQVLQAVAIGHFLLVLLARNGYRYMHRQGHTYRLFARATLICLRGVVLQDARD